MLCDNYQCGQSLVRVRPANYLEKLLPFIAFSVSEFLIRAFPIKFLNNRLPCLILLSASCLPIWDTALCFL